MSSKIITIISCFTLPYIIIYAIYIQLNGEASPGGGFQAGVIFASALILIDMIFDNKDREQLEHPLIVCAALGVMVYAATGLLPMLFGGNYLDYYYLLPDSPVAAQHLGIFLIEIGVGLTVSSVMYLIYIIFTKAE